MRSSSRSPRQKINAAILIPILAVCGPNLSRAQMSEHAFTVRGHAQVEARAHAQAQSDATGPRHLHVDGSGNGKREHIDPDKDHLDTVPHWSGQFTWEGINFPYTMVGTDPANGSATTVIPTFIIPLRIVFADGSVFDSSNDVIDGQTAIQGIVNSPLFQSYPFVSGGTKIGNTQFCDAVQRANFWKNVSGRSKDYHVLLSQPVVLPQQTINVPSDKGGYYQDPEFGPVPYVDDDFFNPVLKALTAQLGINSRQLPIFVTGRVTLDGSSAAAYHGAWYVSPTSASIAGAQTYIATSYSSITSYDGRLPDIYPLSHELSEWINDPFNNNYTPGWDVPGSNSGQCDSQGDGFLWRSRDLMEVCDVIEYVPGAINSVQFHGETYHLTDSVFLDYFTRNPHSSSVNGQYSFFGAASRPSADCAGHLNIDYSLFGVGGATFTEANGLNNLRQIVGLFIDTAGNAHGFLYDQPNNVLFSADVPGAVNTQLNSINDAGFTVGSYEMADGVDHGFMFDQDGNVAALIDYPGAVRTVALSINAVGEVAGEYTDASGLKHGFTYSHGRYQRVDDPAASQTALQAENDLGHFAGYTFNNPSGPFTAFYKTGPKFGSFSYPGAQSTVAFAINDSDWLGGDFFNADGWVDGFVTIAGYPHEIYGDVFGINALGQIAGAYYDSGTNTVYGYTAQLPVPARKK